jgi:hypothetical protein
MMQLDRRRAARFIATADLIDSVAGPASAAGAWFP